MEKGVIQCRNQQAYFSTYHNNVTSEDCTFTARIVCKGSHKNSHEHGIFNLDKIQNKNK